MASLFFGERNSPTLVVLNRNFFFFFNYIHQSTGKAVKIWFSLSAGFGFGSGAQIDCIDNIVLKWIIWLLVVMLHNICTGVLFVAVYFTVFAISLNSCTVHSKIIDFSYRDCVSLTIEWYFILLCVVASSHQCCIVKCW